MTSTYSIMLNALSHDGDRIGCVMLPHEPRDATKLTSIREAMLRGDGVRPVLMADAGDHHIALTGTHRCAAAMGIDHALRVVLLPELTEAEWELIHAAYDDDLLLDALREIAAERDDMAEAVAAMEAEVAANNEAVG